MPSFCKYFFLTFCVLQTATAQWTSDSSVNTQVSPFGMSPIVTTDGNGGAIVFFYDGSGTRAYIQRIDKNGYLRWGNGSPVRVGGYLKNQGPTAICSDGLGGANLQYVETDKTDPPDTGRTLVFTNRIDSNGTLLWSGATGINLGYELFNGSKPWRFNDYDVPLYKIVSSRKNGYYYTWVDSTHPAGANNERLKIQRINPDGSRAFGEYGLSITTDVLYDAAGDIVSDECGGAYVATSFRIFHFDSTGTNMFPDSGANMGRGIISLTLSKNSNKIICLNTVDYANKNCFMTLVDSVGIIQWDLKVLDSINLFLDIPKVITDGKNNINLFWLKQFSNYDYRIFFLKINEVGDFIPNSQKEIFAVSDSTYIDEFQPVFNNSNSTILILGFGGGNVSHNFKTLKIDSVGNASWDGPVILSTHETDQGYIRAVNQNGKGLIAVWYEIGARNGIYAQNISETGRLGEITIAKIYSDNTFPNECYLNRNYPNPFNSLTVINYQISVTCEVTLEVFDMLGRKIKNLVYANQNAGSYSVVFNTQSEPSGIYICRLTAGSYSKAIKMILLK